MALPLDFLESARSRLNRIRRWNRHGPKRLVFSAWVALTIADTSCSNDGCLTPALLDVTSTYSRWSRSVVSLQSARYGIDVLLPTATDQWPLATFLINLTGAFILGMVIEAATAFAPDPGAERLARRLRPFPSPAFSVDTPRSRATWSKPIS